MAALTVPPQRRETLRQALADAIYYRDPPLTCPACPSSGAPRDSSPRDGLVRGGPPRDDALCDDCAARLDRARAYLALSRELGLGPPG